jgi:hypothetical protein
MNDVYRVQLHFKERIVGGIPAVNVDEDAPQEIQEEQTKKAKTVLDAFLRKRLADRMNEEEIAELVDQTYDEAYSDFEAQATSTFKSDENGLLIEGRQCKAMIKEVGSRLGFGKAIKGTRPSLRGDIHEACHVDEDTIYLWEQNGDPGEGADITLKHVTEPHGHETRPIHVWGPQGPQSAIKRSAYVTRGYIEFHVRILKSVTFNEEHLMEILTHGGDLGLGAERSQGFGKYEVIGFEQVEAG